MRVFFGIVLQFFFVLAEIPFHRHSPVFGVSSCVFTNAIILYCDAAKWSGSTHCGVTGDSGLFHEFYDINRILVCNSACVLS